MNWKAVVEHHHDVPAHLRPGDLIALDLCRGDADAFVEKVALLVGIFVRPSELRLDGLLWEEDDEAVSGRGARGEVLEGFAEGFVEGPVCSLAFFAAVLVMALVKARGGCTCRLAYFDRFAAGAGLGARVGAGWTAWRGHVNDLDGCDYADGRLQRGGRKTKK